MTYALVTGASKGIGRAIAQELARQKINLLLVARSETLLSQTARELATTYGVQTDYLALDLAERGAAQRVADWCSEKKYAIHILVNNAGYGLSGQFEQYLLTENEGMMQLNMNALVQLCQLFLPQLRQQPQAYILNIASSAAYQAVPGISLYAATKAFVLSFSRGLRQELAGSSVSVTCISPGATDTEFNDRAQLGEKGRKAAAQVSMTPDAVAKQAVAALFARKAEVITGFVNKLGAFAAWLLPKDFLERTAYKIYQ